MSYNKEQAVQLAENGVSWRAIAKMLDTPASTMSDFLRKHFKDNHKEDIKQVRQIDGVSNTPEDNSRVLLISDMHIPYHHPDTLVFLQHLKDKYKPTRVICLGDEVDHHALSYHDHDPDLASAGDELQKALPIIKQLHGMFPNMDILESNHGSLVWRKAKTHGIPKHYIKAYQDVLGVGEGWKWYFDLTITLPDGNKCYLHHGKSSDIIKVSQQMGMCAAAGHYHNAFKVAYWGNPNGLYWGLQAGCMVNDNSLAFSYNNVNIQRPIIGTGLIINSQPILEPLIMDKNGRWAGENK